MKKFTFYLTAFLLFTLKLAAQFSTVASLNPVTILSNTGETPQSKVWTYAGKHWCVLANSSGTIIYRLDGSTWTNTLVLASGSTAKADIKVVGNVVHIVVWKGTASTFYSVEYNASTNKYKLWTQRTARVDLTLETGVNSIVIDVDANGRMWMASDGKNTINVRWSDSPYSTWSAPVVLATDVTDADQCSVIAMPAIGKTGVFWSNKSTKRFAFKTHLDGSDPTVWSSDEAPGSAGALNIGGGFADSQLDLKETSDGTVYSVIKTNYATAGNTQVGLLVRRPGGTWDPLYQVTQNEGIRPIILVNEFLNKMKVVYTLPTGIIYRESTLSNIAFGGPNTLISGAYDLATSTKATYNPDVVVLASNATTAVGVIGTDNPNPDQGPPSVQSINKQSPATDPTNATTLVYRVTFSEAVTGVDASDFALTATGSATGTISSVAPIGTDGAVYDVTVNSVSGNGTLRLDLKSSGTGITDLAGNAISGGFTSGQTFTIQQSQPTLTSVTIASNNAVPSLAKTGDVITLSFTASEAINPPTVTIATHTVTATAGSNNSYTATYTMQSTDASGIVPLTINFTSVLGIAGNQVTTTTNSSSVTFDKTAPSVLSISRQSPAANPTNATTLVYRVTFSEGVTGVDATDFTLTATGASTGTISTVTPVGAGGTTYDVTVNSVTGNGTLRLDLKASGTGIADTTGNAISGGFSTGDTFTIQQSQPVLTSVAIASNNATASLAKVGDVVTLSFTASEAINPPTVTIATHSVTATAGANNSYTVTYTMQSTDASGLVPFTIDFTSVLGVAGTQVTATSNGSSVTFDKTAPSVLSISRQSPAGNPTNATTLIYRVTFSEGVVGVDASDFTLTATGASTGTISTVTPVGTGGTTYDVTVNSVTGNGTLRLDLKASGTGITDTTGNAISGGFNTGDTFTIQQSQPVLTAVAIASNNAVTSLAKVGDVVTLSFTASEAINAPTVTIATHSVTAIAGANNSYTATYTMVSGDASGVVPFTIDFTSVLGVAGSQVSSTTNGSSVTFDKTAPTVLNIARQSPASNPTSATTLVYRVTFSEGVTGVDATDFTLTATGASTGTISNVAPVGTGGTTYDVTVNSVTGNGTLRLDLKASGTGIADTVGNAISGGFITGDTFTIQQTAPVLTSVTIASNNVVPSLAKVGDVVTLSFTSSVAINPPTVTIATHSVTATAGVNNSYTATYTMVSSDASGVVPFTIDFTSTAGVAGTQVTSTTNGSSVTFDKTAPSVVSINKQSPASDPTNATTLVYRITFSEGVIGVDAADFTLTATGSATGTISTVTAVGTGGTTYDVTVNSVTGNGTLRLDLNASGTGIADTAGNAISAGFTSGQTFTIQQTTPVLTSVTIASNNANTSLAKAGDVVTLSFTASEAINAPTVTIATHSVSATAGANNSYTATYAIQSTDAAGLVPFTIDFTSVLGIAGSRVTSTTNNSSVTFDKTAPSVVSISRQSPSSNPTSATTLVYRVTFSEGVTGVDATDFTLTSTGGVTGTISSIAPVGTGGTTYDVTVSSVTGNGTLRLDLNATATGIADSTGNAISGGFTTGDTFTIQQSAPVLTTVTIASNNATTSLAKVGDIVTLSFTASVAINAPTVTIATHSVTATAGANNSYTATYTMVSADASGVVPFTINFTSTAGVAGTQVSTTTNSSSVTFDKTSPSVVSISRQSPASNPTNATTLVYRVIFSEGVTGVDATDFTLTATGTAAGAISTVTPVGTAGTTYDVTVNSVTGNGTLRLDLKASGTGIADTTGNTISGGFITGDTFTIQQTTPVLTSVTIASNNAVTSLAKVGDVVTLSFTASEAINAPNVTIATHSVTATAGANNSYTATYTMTASDAFGVVPFTINFTSVLGVAGSQVSSTTNGSSVTFDKTSPSVVSINKQSPASDPTNATTLVYRVTFSEGVTGVDATDFTLTATGSATGTISSVAPVGTGGTTYDVTVSSVSGNGTLRVDLKASGTGIADTAGNAISGGFTSGQTFTIQQTQPTLTSVTIVSNNATPSLAKVGNVITLSFTASIPINTPTVTIATHSVTATAGANNSYTATYSMVSVDASGIIPFTIDFTSTQGVAGTQVTTTTNGSTVTFDKTAPSVVSINKQSPPTDPTNATTLVFRVTFSEGVTGVDASDFLLTSTGATVGTISSVAAVGTGGSTYDVTVNSVTGNGTLRLDLKANGTGITDTAGNAISGGFTSGQTFTIQQTITPTGFTSVTYTSTIPLSLATKEKQQSKVWFYNNKWWSVVSAVGGTKIFRLDNTTWTEILTLTTKTSKPDVRVVGNVVHLFLYKGADNTALLYSVEYDPATNKYKLWSKRPTSSNIVMPSGSETSSFTIDGTGRMWLGSAGTSSVYVWYTDLPYSSWSAPITIATGIKDDDICALATIPIQNKICIFWSNQITKRFGFRTHDDGAAPGTWSVDEVPASQSAIDNSTAGFADDHMNIKVASDGTVYVASKTSYNTNGFPKLILLVRRPNGIWDDVYPVTTNPEGTQPIVILNEAINTIKVIYATVENGGDIMYRVSSTTNIAFGPPILLFGGNGKLYDYVTSTYQNYNPEIVVMVTNLSTSPIQAEGFIGEDGNSSPIAQSRVPAFRNATASNNELKANLAAFPNPFSTSVTVNYTLFNKGKYELNLYDVRGIKVAVIREGWADAGVQNTVKVDGTKLANGIYWLNLQTQDGIRTVKLFVQK